MAVYPRVRFPNNFSIADENRDINMTNVETLASFVDECYLLDLYPIVIGEGGIIVDGQHRYTVGEGMAEPMFFVHDESVTIRDIFRANGHTHEYTEDEMLHVYSSMAIPAYVEICKIREAFPGTRFRPGELAMYMNHGQTARSQFASGCLSMPSRDLAWEVARHIDSVRRITRRSPAMSYRKVFFFLISGGEYDSGAFEKKLRMDPGRMPLATQLNTALDGINNVYNYRRRNKVVLRMPTARERNKMAAGVDADFDGCDTARAGGHSDGVNVEIVSPESLILHDFARVPDAGRVRKLSDAISEKNMLNCFPVVIDADNRILDGGHRWEAAKRLGLSLHAIRVADVTMPMIVMAHSKARPWSNADVLSYFAKMGVESYVLLRDLIGEFDMFTLHNVIRHGSRTGGATLTSHKWKNGTWTFDYPNAMLYLDSKMARAGKLPGSIIRATLMMLGNPDFSLDRMVDALSRHPGDVPVRAEETYPFLDAIYNKGLHHRVDIVPQSEKMRYHEWLMAKENELSGGAIKARWLDRV